MLAEICICCWGIRFELLAKNMLCRPRLAGNLGESQKKRLRQPSAAHGIDADGLLFGGPLQNHYVQVLNPPREFRPPAQNLIELLYFFVQGGCPLEVQLLAGFLTLFLDSRPRRSPARFEKLHEPLYFDVVFFFRAARKAWREAHFHLRVQATRKRRITADLDLAAPHFEQVEDPFGECLRGPPRCEWPVIRAARGRAGLIDGNPAGHVAARI